MEDTTVTAPFGGMLNKGDLLRVSFRRRFWYKPWTWFKKNYVDRRITSVDDKYTITLDK